MITLSEFKRGKDKKKRKMRKPSLENHVVKGLKYGAGIGGGAGALIGAGYGTMVAPGAGTIIGAGYGGVSGALGGAIDGALISLPVYGVNRYRYNQENSKGRKVNYKR